VTLVEDTFIWNNATARMTNTGERTPNTFTFNGSDGATHLVFVPDPGQPATDRSWEAEFHLNDTLRTAFFCENFA